MDLDSVSVHKLAKKELGQYPAILTSHLVNNPYILDLFSGREITWLSGHHRFRKAPFSKRFPSTLKRKAGVFKFLRFEEIFRKAPFSGRINVEGRPNRRNKVAFSNFSGVLWTGPKNVFISFLQEFFESCSSWTSLWMGHQPARSSTRRHRSDSFKNWNILNKYIYFENSPKKICSLIGLNLLVTQNFI